MEADGVRGGEPHWKTLLRDAQQAELAAASLRVERMRVVRAADEFCARFASLSATDPAVGCHHAPDTTATEGDENQNPQDTEVNTVDAEDHGPALTPTQRETMRTQLRGSIAAQHLLPPLHPATTIPTPPQSPLTQPKAAMAEAAVATTAASLAAPSGSNTTALPNDDATVATTSIGTSSTEAEVGGTPKQPVKNSADGGAEWTTERLTRTLATLEAPWTERVAGLTALASGTQAVDAGLATALAVQLLDLRSKVVVAAAEAVACSACRTPVHEALVVARAALDGVAANKQVMHQARSRAHAAVMKPHGSEDAAWAHVCEHAAGHPTERARIAAVRAAAAWAPTAPVQRDGQLAQVLSASLEDKAKAVRDAGRALWVACTTAASGFGAERLAELRKQLGASVTRLPDAGTSKSSKRTSVRDLVRKRRAQQARLSEPT